MKKIINTVFYMFLLTLPLTGRTETTGVNDVAIEVTSLSISIDNSLNGYAIVKRCPTCADIRLNIDRTTQVTRHQGKIIPLRNIMHLQAHFATIIYDPKTKHVKQIVW